MLETFTPATFRPCIGQVFSVAASPSRQLSLTLVSCTGAQRPFSLIFRGPLEHPLPQKTHPFSHPALGAFDLFIVPVGRDEAGFLYEAVFN
ncbi:hypothetical protein HS125_09695 [bacterium]|nr:hypothetical protein [bacterium]